LRGDFESDEGVVRYISDSKNFNPEAENSTDAEPLLIFSTSKQRAWFVATSERLYCIVDDIRKEKPRINWSIPKRELVSGKDVSVKLITREKNELSGFIDIGTHPNWLYTKRLFVDDHIRSQIRLLIMRKMID